MSRTAEARYYPSRGGYFAWIKGKQTKLAVGPNDKPDGPTYQAALRRFAELQQGPRAPATLAGLAAPYLEWIGATYTPDTTAIRRQGLAYVLPTFGERYAESITLEEVERWARTTALARRWAAATIGLCFRSLRGCLNWARDRDLIARHGLDKLRVPPDRSRGLECVVDDDTADAAERVCRFAQLRQLLVVLRRTGARPGELRKATAADFRADLGAIVYEPAGRDGRAGHKTGRTGKRRVILLTGQALAIVRALAERHPTGPLFRSSQVSRTGPGAGKKWGWSKQGLVNAFCRLRRRLKIRGFVPYSYRHSFAVKWLRAGRSAIALAAVLGTSLQMIERHYGHLAEQTDFLRLLCAEHNAESVD